MKFNLFKKIDPVCGMKEEKGNGVEAEGKWFCSNNCMNKYTKEKLKSHGCCGGH